MRIGIIGAGWLGGTVGKVLCKAGHEVLFSSRNPKKHEDLASRLGERASAGSLHDAATFGDVVVVALPERGLENLDDEVREALIGKVVLDACNPKSIADYAPGARVVRAFSAVDATAIEASYEDAEANRGSRLGVPLAADDQEALEMAIQLVLDAGCDPVVVGSLSDAGRFARGAPGFRVNSDAATLRRRLHLG